MATPAYDKLNDEQIRMLALVLEGKTYVQIADEMGVHINTVYQRKNKEDFKAALKERYQEAVGQAQRVFSTKAAWAAQKIVDMVDDPEATRVQFQAACKVYDSAVGVTIEEFEDRLIEIEDSVTREV